MRETYPAWPGIIAFVLGVGLVGIVGWALERVFGRRDK